MKTKIKCIVATMFLLASAYAVLADCTKTYLSCYPYGTDCAKAIRENQMPSFTTACKENPDCNDGIEGYPFISCWSTPC